jgi:hypothetical protein
VLLPRSRLALVAFFEARALSMVLTRAQGQKETEKKKRAQESGSLQPRRHVHDRTDTLRNREQEWSGERQVKDYVRPERTNKDHREYKSPRSWVSEVEAGV